MISLISKFKRRTSFLVLLLVISCSSSKAPEAIPSEAELEETLSSLSKEGSKPIDFGPTLSTGSNRFVDKTLDYGLQDVEGVTFAMIDLNRDLIDDLVVLPGYFSQPRFFIFDVNEMKFKEADYEPVKEVLQASFLVFADFNRDGITDMAVGVLNQRGEFTKLPVTLWNGSYNQNQKLIFTKNLKFPELPAEPASSIVAVDVNLDGRLDLFIGNWFHEHDKNLLPTADRLLINYPDGWVDHSDWLTGESNKSSDDLYPPLSKPTYGASSCDVDQDGWPDILTANSVGHYNKLWMNRSKPTSEARRFEDMGKESGMAADPQGILVPTGGGRSFSAVCADYNDDGVMDLFLGELTHGWDNLSVDRSSVLTGNKITYPPSFLRTEYMSDAAADNWNQGDKRAQWVDLNLDGLVDILVDNSGFPPDSRLVAFAQDETRAFLNVAHQWGMDIVNPTGTIVADFNNDGKPDILTGQSNIRRSSMKNRLYVLENQLSLPGRRAIKFYLQGKEANQQGLGAMVMLYTEREGKKVIQRRWNEFSQGGIPSQNPAGVHFGVDATTKILGVKVRWPIKQTRSVLRGKALERLYSIHDTPNAEFQIYTLCENGSIQPGRFNCP
ncbi:MAG: CRTAC1 family protein [Bacteriovoracaceae bacterium]|nr:CRTAC1 family protein [Bacteriovoracaceae bacterium]